MKLSTTRIVVIVIVAIFVVGAIIWSFNNRQTDGAATPPTPGSADDTNTPTPARQEQQEELEISLVSLENAAGEDDTFGCGDSTVNIQRVVSLSGDNRVEAALSELFTIEQTITDDGEDLYNSLSNSNLAVEEVVSSENTIRVDLVGQLRLGGTCDNPRVEEQLKSTVMANTQIDDVVIILNNQPLSETLNQDN